MFYMISTLISEYIYVYDKVFVIKTKKEIAKIIFDKALYSTLLYIH